MSAKTEAGQALIDAIKAGDPAAVVDAYETIEAACKAPDEETGETAPEADDSAPAAALVLGTKGT